MNNIDKIELELLSALLNYAVPFVDKKLKAPGRDKKPGNLENIVSSKPKISFNDIKELEKLLMKNLNSGTESNKKAWAKSGRIFYSLNLTRQKSRKEKTGDYSIAIKYEENGREEKLSVSVTKSGVEVYSAEKAEEKPVKDRVAPYSIQLNYEDAYGEERLSVTYRQQLKNYIQQHIKSKEDMTERVPLKWLNILPETMMGGVLGFTYLGENFMGRRADLTGKTARMVDIHESIHTPDEYETRVLTSWIMSKEKSKYIK